MRERWIEWSTKLRNAVWPSRDEREVAEEMAFHLEKTIEEKIASGASPEEARREARLEFGGVEKYRAEARDVRFGHGLELLVRDFRLGARRLLRAPAFSGMVVLTLALALAAAGTIWALARSLLAPELPYAEPHRTVAFRTSWTDQPRGGLSPAELRDYESRLDHVFESVGAATNSRLTLLTADGAARVKVALVTQGLFDALGARPALGRGFTEQEVRDGAFVAVLSHRLWRERFAADESILGRPLRVAGGELEIVGVLAPGLDLPAAVVRGERHDVFAPLQVAATIPNRGNHYLEGFARLRRGVELDTARAEVEALGASFLRDYPGGYPPENGFRVTVEPVTERLSGPARAPLLLLGLLVTLLLVVAVTNVAGLMLARLEQRGPELALTHVLGAGRGQLARQIAVEHFLLTAIAGLAGATLARAATLWLAQALPAAVGHLIQPRPDMFWVIFGLTALVLLLLIVSLRPAGHRRLAVSLRSASRRASGTRRGLGLRQNLVAGQVALSLILLTLAALLAGSFLRLARVDPGYRTANLATTQIGWPNFDGDPDPLRTVTLHRRLVEQVQSMPGVRAAAAARFLVLEDRPGDMSFEFEGRPVPEGERKPAADWQVVTPGYFDTLAITIERGRPIEAGDDENAEGAVVVDRTFVDSFLPGESAIGRRLRFGGEHTGPRWARIVGIAGDVRHSRLDEGPRPRVYIAHAQFRGWASGSPINALHLILDTELPLATVETQLRSVLERLHPATPMDPLRPIEAVRAQSLLIPRLLALFPAAFGAVALLLAVIGLFGLVMQAVLMRRFEIGIRQALGARRVDIVRDVFWQGFRLSLAGGLLGLAAALALARAVEARLYDTSAFDPAALLGAWALLTLAVALACLLPALRAARIDPVALLRLE